MPFIGNILLSAVAYGMFWDTKSNFCLIMWVLISGLWLYFGSKKKEDKSLTYAESK